MSRFGVLTPALIAAYQAGGHSVFRPSSASRWMVCPGSIRAEIAMQADTAGFAAAQGTVCHAIAEHMLQHGGARPPWATLVTVRKVGEFEVPVTDEMLSWAQQYYDWCEGLGPADHVGIETRVDFSDLTPIPGQGGTADHIHIAGDTLTITDAKFGVVVRVYAAGNKQAQLYAYGAWREWSWAYDIKKIVIRICQPRLDVFETWTLSVEELLEFAQEAKKKAHLAWQEDAPLHPEPNACRYCTAQAQCPALQVAADLLADAMLDDLDELEVDPETVSDDLTDRLIEPRVEPREMSTKALATVLRWRRPFEAWFRSIADELERRITAGEAGNGWEIEEAVTKRSWKNEAATAAALEELGLMPDDIYEPRKLRSPKQIEDRLRAKQMKPAPLMRVLAEKPRGRMVLVQTGEGVGGQASALDAMLDDLD